MTREVFIVKNITVSEIELKDFGLIIPSGVTVDLTDFDNATISNELYNYILIGDIVRVIDGVEITDIDKSYDSTSPYYNQDVVYSNVLTVSKSGSTFTTINSALDYITDNASDKRYLIQVTPSTYGENITMKPFVDIKGLSGYAKIEGKITVDFSGMTSSTRLDSITVRTFNEETFYINTEGILSLSDVNIQTYYTSVTGQTVKCMYDILSGIITFAGSSTNTMYNTNSGTIQENVDTIYYVHGTEDVSLIAFNSSNRIITYEQNNIISCVYNTNNNSETLISVKDSYQYNYLYNTNPFNKVIPMYHDGADNESNMSNTEYVVFAPYNTTGVTFISAYSKNSVANSKIDIFYTTFKWDETIPDESVYVGAAIDTYDVVEILNCFYNTATDYMPPIYTDDGYFGEVKQIINNSSGYQRNSGKLIVKEFLIGDVSSGDTQITSILNETDMVSNSPNALATQYSIKSYVDNVISGVTSGSTTLQAVTNAGSTTTIESTFSGGLVLDKLRPSSDSTTAIQINKTDGVSTIINIDTNSGLTGFGTINPQGLIHAYGTDNDTESLIGTQTNAIIIDGAPDVDKDIAWFEDGDPRWLAETYRNEDAEFWYLYSVYADNSPLTVMRTGRIGINKVTNIMGYHGALISGGTQVLNDLEISGIYTENHNSVYELEINGTGATDTFRWRLSIDGGLTYGSWSATSGVTITATELQYGVNVQWGSLSGHTIDTTWRFGAYTQIPQATFSVAPMQWGEVLRTLDYTADPIKYIDQTANANGGVSTNTFTIFDAGTIGTTQAFIWGTSVQIHSIFINMNTVDQSLILIVEYYNGTTWIALTFDNNHLIDSTENLTKSGQIIWHPSTMTGWIKTEIPNTIHGAEQYWMRIRTSANPSVTSIANGISIGNDKRFSVYESHGDFRPAFYVDSIGRTNIGGGSISRKNLLQINEGNFLDVVVGSGSIFETDATNSLFADHRIKLVSDDAYSAGIVFVKTRGDLEATTGVLYGDEIGHIWWRAKVGTSPNPTTGVTLSSIESIYTGDGNASSLHGDIIFNTANGTPLPTERVRITSSGTTGFGISNAVALVHLGAGTTNISPLKFTYGNLLSSPQEGTVEFDGSVWYGTISGDTRKQFAFTSDLNVFNLQEVTDNGATTTNESTFSGGLITNNIKTVTDSISALQIQNSSGDTIININTVSGFTGFGTVIPENQIHIYGTDTYNFYGINTQSNAINIDGVSGADKSIMFSNEGEVKWGAGLYRNEGGKYWDLVNIQARSKNITVSEGGRIGINNPTALMDYHALLLTGGPNDIIVGGSFNQNYNMIFEVEIDTVSGATDTFRFRTSFDDGYTFTTWSTSSVCTTGITNLIHGVNIAFESVTGHILGTQFTFVGFSTLPNGTFTITPNKFNQIKITSDYNAGTIIYDDITPNGNNSISVNPINIFNTGITSNAIYFGALTQFNNLFVNLETNGDGIFLIAEYWNGSSWVNITTIDNKFLDGTLNLTQSGNISWDITSMGDWIQSYIPDLAVIHHNLFWLRLRTSTSTTITPVVKSFARNGQYRFSVVSSPNDTRPSFFIDSLGRTSIGGGNIVGKNLLQIGRTHNVSESQFESMVQFDSEDYTSSGFRLRLSQENDKGFYMGFAKNRGTTENPEPVHTGDDIGSILWGAAIDDIKTGILLGSINVEYTGDNVTKYGDMIFKTHDNIISPYPIEVFRLSGKGNAGFGIGIPTARIHIQSGTTSVAPLKIEYGDLLTTPQAGAIEFDGITTYITTSGLTRETFAYLNNPTFTGDVYLPVGTVYANGVRTNTIHPLSDGYDTLKIINASGNTTLVTFNTLSGFTGFGTVIPETLVHLYGTDTDDDTPLGIQTNGVRLDGVIGSDKDIQWAEDGEVMWIAQTYRNENARYWYLYNQFTDTTPFVASEDGRVGINNQTNIMDYHPVQIQGSLNDLVVGGLYSESYNRVYQIKIDSISGATDTYQWRSSINGGFIYGSWSDSINLTTTPVEIEFGITVNFENLTGHIIDDTWEFGAFSQLPIGSFVVTPPRINGVIRTDNYLAGTVTYNDITGAINTSSSNATTILFNTGSTTDAIYFGNLNKMNGIYFNLSQFSQDATLITEYWNGSIWTPILFNVHSYLDNTNNLENGGLISWEIVSMTDWVVNYPPDYIEDGYELYWVRIRTSSPPTQQSIVLSVADGGNYRMAVLSAPGDYNPSFYVDSLGRTNIGGGNITGKNKFQINTVQQNIQDTLPTIFEIDSQDSEAIDIGIKLTSDNNVPSGINIGKSRGDLLNPTSSQNGDSIGHITFRTISDSGTFTLSQISTIYSGDGSTQYGDLIFGVASGSDSIEKVRITSNGTGFGVSDPLAIVHLSSGTTSIAPLKFEHGDLLTTPQHGAMEFYNGLFYGTVSGDNRKTFAFLESPEFTGSPELPIGTTLNSDNLYDLIDLSGGTNNTLLTTKSEFDSYTGSTLPWDKVDKTDSDLADLETRDAQDVNYSEANWEITNVKDGLDKLTDYNENILGSGRISPEIVLGGLLTDTIQISGGTGYINYENFHSKISWSADTINLSGVSEGMYWVYVGSSGNIQTSDSEPNAVNNVKLGKVYWNGQKIGTVIQSELIISNSTNRINDFMARLGYFIYDGGGKVGLLSGSTLKLVSTSCKVQYGSITVGLNEISANDTSDYSFRITYISSDEGADIYFYLTRKDGEIPTDRWNDTTQNSREQLSGYTLTFTSGSTNVTSTSDLTSILSHDDHIFLEADTHIYSVPISGVSWNGTLTTITLENTYLGDGGNGVATVNRALPKIPAGKYMKSMVTRTTDNIIAVFLGQHYFDNLDLATAGAYPGIPGVLRSVLINMASFTYVAGETDLTGKIGDIRPLPFSFREGGVVGGGVVTIHGDLSGLDADDHLQYLRTDGTRALTGIQQYDTNKTFTTDLDVINKKYVDDQDNLKLNITVFNTFTGTTLPTNYYNKNEINEFVTGYTLLSIFDSYTGVTNTTLEGKQDTITGAATTITDSNLTINRALISNGSGKVAISPVTSTELGYLVGVSSAIQTQINDKAPLASPTFTGTPLSTTAVVNTSTTQIATTAFVIGQASNVNPLMDGTTAIGTSLRYARQDHVHPSDTSKLDVTTFSTYTDTTAPSTYLSITDFNTFSGNTSIDLSDRLLISDFNTFTGTTLPTNYYNKTEINNSLSLKADLASPTFTGTPLSTTAVVNTSTTQIATTAFVLNQASNVNPLMDGTVDIGTSFMYSRQDHIHPSDTSKLDVTTFSTYSGNTITSLSLKANLVSPTFTGTPLSTTATVGTNTTQIATTAYYINSAANTNPLMNGTVSIGTSTRFARQDHVHASDTTKANLLSPTFTGTPLSTTAAANTNTTQIATTEFVLNQAANVNPLMDGTVSIGTSLRYARQDHRHATDTTLIPKVVGAVSTNIAAFNSDGTIYDSGVALGSLTGGTGYYIYGENETSTSTTSTTPQLYLTASGTLTSGTFSLDFIAVIGNNTKSRAAYVQFYMDGSPLSVPYSFAPAIAGDLQPIPYMKDLVITAGPHTFQVYYYTSFGTTVISRAAIRVKLVSG